jgi:hypothetical protein
MNRSLLIRDRRLVSSGISIVLVAVFVGGLVVEECPFLRMKLEVDLYYVVFVLVFSFAFRLYTTPLFL